MAKINFDPELMRNIKIIYGDANLDGKTLKLLYQTWKTNPEIIKRTAQLKMPELKKVSFNIQSSALPNSLKMLTQEIADDDLRGIKNFNTAFKEARKRKLKQFTWGKGTYGTDLKQSLNNTSLNKPKSFTILLTPLSNYLVHIETPNLIASTKKITWGKGLPSITGNTLVTNKLNNATINKYIMRDTVQNGNFEDSFMGFSNYLNNRDTTNWYNRNKQVNSLGYFQQGGQVNSLQQEMQKKFIQFLILDAAKQGIEIKSELDLQKYAQSLGKEGLKAKQLEFVLVMQSGVMAKLGAKLEYVKKLKGICPEGYELKFFKLGGRFCKVCEKGEKLKQKEYVSKNDTVHVNGKPYDLTGKHKQYPKLTNDKYRKLPASKQTDVDLKDLARKDKCGAKLKKKKK